MYQPIKTNLFLGCGILSLKFPAMWDINSSVAESYEVLGSEEMDQIHGYLNILRSCCPFLYVFIKYVYLGDEKEIMGLSSISKIFNTETIRKCSSIVYI